MNEVSKGIGHMSNDQVEIEDKMLRDYARNLSTSQKKKAFEYQQLEKQQSEMNFRTESTKVGMKFAVNIATDATDDHF